MHCALLSGQDRGAYSHAGQHRWLVERLYVYSHIRSYLCSLPYLFTDVPWLVIPLIMGYDMYGRTVQLVKHGIRAEGQQRAQKAR